MQISFETVSKHDRCYVRHGSNRQTNNLSLYQFVFRGLPDKDQELLTMAEHSTAAIIAKRLKTSPTAVWKRLSRARAEVDRVVEALAKSGF